MRGSDGSRTDSYLVFTQELSHLARWPDSSAFLCRGCHREGIPRIRPNTAVRVQYRAGLSRTPGRDRTDDFSLKRRKLCQLSYGSKPLVSEPGERTLVEAPTIRSGSPDQESPRPGMGNRTPLSAVLEAARCAHHRVPEWRLRAFTPGVSLAWTVTVMCPTTMVRI